jgi:parallel beta-helix repeat protein
MAVTEPNASETVNSGELGHVAHTRRLAKLANQAKAEINGRLSDDALSATFAGLPGATVNGLTGWFHADGMGIAGDGVTNDTAAIQAAVNTAAAASRRLYFPRGSGAYRITSTITVPDNAEVELAPGAAFSFAVGVAFSIAGDNVQFRGGEYIADASTRAAFSIADSVNGVTIADIICTEATVLQRTTSSYASATPDKLARNITVQGVRAHASSATTTTAIRAQFVDGMLISDCTISGYRHGIAWWGGDSNPAVDGSVDAERRTRNITITGNTITDVTMGGIWGSMGEHVTVTGNTVLRCGDVGIDAEGSYDVTISGNTVADCTFGGITTFFLNRNVTIAGNSIAAFGNTPCVKVYNSQSGSYQANYGITISGNSMRATTMAAAWAASTAYVAGAVRVNDSGKTYRATTSGTSAASGGPTGTGTTITDGTVTWTYVGVAEPAQINIESSLNVLVEGNSLTNVRIIADATSGNYAGLTVTDNVLTFLHAATTAFPAISVGKARIHWGHTVKDNRAFSLVTQPTGNVAIRVASDDANSSPQYLVEGNDVRGFETDIALVLGGSNAGQGARVMVRDNKFQASPVISTTFSGTYTGTVRWEGNRNGSWLPYPLAVPTGVGKWERGQQIEDDDPAAGGNIGWVCTTAGWTGITAWAASTAYTVGDLRTNDSGKVYACTTAGTSAASGGPTGTGTAISDGTVTWRYVGVQAVWKTFGVVAA